MTSPRPSDDLVVHHVDMLQLRDKQLYVASVEHEKFDDFIGLTARIIPTGAFETHAAIYDIDTDTEDGWDDLLHLMFGPQDEPGPIEEELANPDHWLNAPTIEHARKAKVRKVRAAMGQRRLLGMPGHSEHRLAIREAKNVVSSDAEDPLEFIKRTAPMSPEHIAVKQEFVRRKRHLARARRAGLGVNDLVGPGQPRRGLDDQAQARESPEQLARRWLGRPLDEVSETRLPPRLGPPSKRL